MADDLVKLKEQVYIDPRPKELFDTYHVRTREKEPGAAYELVRLVTSLVGVGFYRTVAYGTERIPASGPLVIAPNHFSNFDHFFMGLGTRRKIHFMAKSQMFKPPIDRLYANGGTFPVRRGQRDDEAFKTVHAILDRGGCMAMYCEGGRSRSGKLAERAKPGIGRIALESGATILPCAIHGSSHVRNLKRGHFPKITILFGEPMRWERVGPGNAPRDDSQAVADAVFDEIKDLYAAVEAGGREVAKVWAPGWTPQAPADPAAPDAAAAVAPDAADAQAPSTDAPATTDAEAHPAGAAADLAAASDDGATPPAGTVADATAPGADRPPAAPAGAAPKAAAPTALPTDDGPAPERDGA